MTNEEKWLHIYNEAVKYYKENGNLLICSRYEVNDIKLGHWILDQRVNYKKGKLSEERVELLNKIGMIWGNSASIRNDINWYTMYKEAVKYYNENGNLNVAQKYTYNGQALGNWIVLQRQMNYEGTLKEERVELLNKIGMVWSVRNRNSVYSWEFMYHLAKKYYEENGDLFIPTLYIINIDGVDIKLGEWIKNQRNFYRMGKLSNERISLLEKININWTGVKRLTYDKRWLLIYNEALKYFKEHNNLVVPENYLVSVEDKPILLNNWISTQRKFLTSNDLDDVRKKLIVSLFDLVNETSVKSASDLSFMKYYRVCEMYFEEYGNLNVPSRYEVTINNETIKLGQWINSQRMSYRGKRPKLSDERIRMLEEVGMVWYPRGNTLTLK